MMPHKLSVFFVILIMLAGCTSVYRRPAAQPEISAANPRIGRFEREVVQRALMLEQKGQWVEAEAAFRDGLALMPNSGLISAARARFLQRRADRQAVVDADLALAQGHMLMARSDALDEAIRLRGAQWWIRLRQYRNDSDRKAMAAKLAAHGAAAMKRRDWELAKDCYGLSMVLSPTAAAARELHHAQVALQSRPVMQPARPMPAPTPAKATPTPKRAASSPPQQSAANSKRTIIPLTADQRLEIMQMEFERAYSQGKLAAAQHHMAMLQMAFPEDDHVAGMADRFQAEINNRIESDLRRGRRLYSSGDVNGALAVWRQALILAPDDEDLKANVARAERVLENIRVLTEKQVK